MLAGASPLRAASRSQILDIVEGSDSRHLIGALERRRLLPLLGARLRDLAPSALPEALSRAVAAATARDRAAAMALEVHADLAINVLRDAGVVALALKGPALALSAHGDIGLRSSGDVDILVAPDDLRRAAVGALSRQGYVLLDDPVDGAGLPVLHRRLSHPQRPRVELHWRVHWHETAFSRDMLARSRPGPDGRLEAHPADLGASLLLFFARDGFYGLRLAADIAGWWDRHRDALGTGLLDEYTRRYPELSRTWHASARAAERLVGVPVDAWLTEPPPTDRRTTLALRLSNWSQDGDPDQLAVNIMLVDALLGPPGSWRRLLRRQLKAAPGGRRTPHLMKIGLRAVAAFNRVRRRRWVAPLPRRAAAPVRAGA